MPQQQRGRRRMGLRVTAAAVSAAAASALCVVGVTHPRPGLGQPPALALHGRAHGAAGASCHLGNGVKHVVEIGFDNVHYLP